MICTQNASAGLWVARILIFFFVALTSEVTYSDVYKFIGPNGKIIYTDDPKGSGLKLVLPGSDKSTESEWKLISYGRLEKGEGVYFYVHKSRILKAGKGKYQAWILKDFDAGMRAQNGLVYRSELTMEEDDCIKRTQDIKTIDYYSDQMKSGALVYSIESKISSPFYVRPDSIGDLIQKYICRSEVK